MTTISPILEKSRSQKIYEAHVAAEALFRRRIRERVIIDALLATQGGVQERLTDLRVPPKLSYTSAGLRVF